MKVLRILAVFMICTMVSFAMGQKGCGGSSQFIESDITGDMATEGSAVGEGVTSIPQFREPAQPSMIDVNVALGRSSSTDGGGFCLPHLLSDKVNTYFMIENRPLIDDVWKALRKNSLEDVGEGEAKTEEQKANQENLFEAISGYVQTVVIGVALDESNNAIILQGKDDVPQDDFMEFAKALAISFNKSDYDESKEIANEVDQSIDVSEDKEEIDIDVSEGKIDTKPEFYAKKMDTSSFGVDNVIAIGSKDTIKDMIEKLSSGVVGQDCQFCLPSGSDRIFAYAMTSGDALQRFALGIMLGKEVDTVKLSSAEKGIDKDVEGMTDEEKEKAAEEAKAIAALDRGDRAKTELFAKELAASRAVLSLTGNDDFFKVRFAMVPKDSCALNTMSLEFTLANNDFGKAAIERWLVWLLMDRDNDETEGEMIVK